MEKTSLKLSTSNMKVYFEKLENGIELTLINNALIKKDMSIVLSFDKINDTIETAKECIKEKKKTNSLTGEHTLFENTEGYRLVMYNKDNRFLYLGIDHDNFKSIFNIEIVTKDMRKLLNIIKELAEIE